MTTTGRWKALRWFKDHAEDINSVAGTRMPSARMRRTMLKEGQLRQEPVGSFGHQRFTLTEAGHALLASKRKHKRRKPSIEEQLNEAIP